jgi:hyperosmotically inducible periplasmic protein
MWNLRTVAIIIAVVGALSLASCSNTGNENANTSANANMTANANSPAVANTNANANTNRRTAPTREEYEKNKEKYSREAKETGRTIGTGLNDGWLWVKTRYDLAAANDLQDSTINVDVDNGVVTLTGTVPTAPQKAKAEQIAKAVEGVKSVKNEIKVAPPANKNANANANRPTKK